MSSTIVRVFVSSTWLDLQPEREAIEKALQRMQTTKLIGMEYFGSRDAAAREASLKEVDRSQVYLGIFAGRYGSGITEAEYRRARERGLECKLYFKDESTVTQFDDEPEKREKLQALKKELRERHLISEPFTNPDQLTAQVTADLHDWIVEKYLPSQQQTSAYNALHQLPPPPRDFAGRADESQEFWENLDNGVTIFGWQGLGGVGKTALALELAERIKDLYPDAQFYLDLKGASSLNEKPLTPAEAMAHVIRAYQPTVKLPEKIDDLKPLYHSMLAGKRALLVMDNAENREQVEPLIPPPGCILFVTSRQAFTVPGWFAKRLDTLSQPDAHALLLKIAPQVETGVADRICKLCGYLPLAIRAAGSLLAATDDLEPGDYASELEEEHTRLGRIGAEGVNLSVEASFNLSYGRLEEEKARVFRQLAVFPASFDARAAEIIAGDEGHQHLSQLLRFGLVLYDKGAKRYRLQDLVRLFADRCLSEKERAAAKRRHARHYRSALEQAGVSYLRGADGIKSGLKLFDLERENIETGQAWAASLAETDDEAAQLSIDYPDAGLKASFYLLSLRQLPNERVRWLETALSSARRLNQRGSEGDVLSSLALTHAELGDLRRPIPYCEQSLLIHREVGNRRGEGIALSLLSFACATLGEPGKAIELCEQVLTIASEIGDPRLKSSGLSNLGLVYSFFGEPRKAIELCERGLAIAREIGDRRIEGLTNVALALAYSSLSEPRRAMELCEQALPILREIDDRIGKGLALSVLGVSHAALGEPRKAVDFCEQALPIHREIGCRSGEGLALFGLGLAQIILNEPRKGAESCEKALLIFREIGDRRSEGGPLLILGLAHAALDDPRRAIEFGEQALSIFKEFGDRKQIGLALGILGDAYRDLGEPRMAIEFYERRLAIACEIHDRIGESLTLTSLGLIYYAALGEPQKAIGFYKQRLAIAREVGDRSGEVLSLDGLGLAYNALREPRNAIEFFEQALLIHREIGERNSECLTLNALGNAHLTLGEPQKAIELYEQQLAIAREIGDRNQELTSLGLLSNACLAARDPHKAIKFYEPYLAIARETGDRGSEGLALGGLGYAHSVLGESQRTVEFYEQALAIHRDIGNRHWEATDLWNLGLALDQLGERARAIACAEAALKICEETESPYIETVRQKLAEWRGQ